MGPRGRAALLAALFVLAALASVWYAAAVADNARHPPAHELDESPETYVGTEVEVWLTVDRVENGTVVGVKGWRVPAAALPAAVGPGDVVQVFGTLKPDRRIDVERAVVSPQGERRLMLVASALAALGAAGYALYHWRPTRTLRLVPRRGGRR